MPEPGAPAATGFANHAINGHVGNGAFVLNVGEKIAEGRYGDAAFATGMRIAFTPKVYEAAATLTKAVAPVAKGLSWVGRNLPIIGGVVMAAYDAKEVYDHIKKGDYKGAAVAAAAGVVEVAATTTMGGLAGAGARTLVVEGVAAAGGPRVNDAMLVSVAKEAVHLGSKFVSDHTHHEPAATAHHEPAKPAAPKAKTSPSPA